MAIATPLIAPAPPTETTPKRRSKTIRTATTPTDTSIAPEISTKRRGKAKAATTETTATDAAIATAAVATTPAKQRGQRTGRQAKAVTATAPTETAAKPTARAGKSAKANTRKKQPRRVRRSKRHPRARNLGEPVNREHQTLRTVDPAIAPLPIPTTTATAPTIPTSFAETGVEAMVG